MQAACLAGAVQAPLWVWHGEAHEQEKLSRVLREWGTQDVLAIGAAAHRCRHLPDVHVARFADEKAVAAAYLSQQVQRGPIETLVVANPADVKKLPYLEMVLSELGFDVEPGAAVTAAQQVFLGAREVATPSPPPTAGWLSTTSSKR